MMMSNLARVPRGKVADHAELSGSLRAAARLVALVADQVDAAGQGHTRWVAWLDEQRDVLLREIFVAGSDTGDAGPLPEIAAGIARLVDQADGILAGRSEEEQRLQDWIDVLESASFPVLHECREWMPLRHHGSTHPAERVGNTPR
jgi:hypothetical protein